jgi:MFS family permease
MDPELMRLAAILLVGAIAALLDTTIVNVAIRTIGRDLHAPLGTVQWVMTGYLLSYGMVIPLSGWALARRRADDGQHRPDGRRVHGAAS